VEFEFFCDLESVFEWRRCIPVLPRLEEEIRGIVFRKDGTKCENILREYDHKGSTDTSAICKNTFSD